MRRQSKERDAAGRATNAAADDALAEAKRDFNGQGPGAVAEDKHHLSQSPRSGGQTKWYVPCKVLPVAALEVHVCVVKQCHIPYNAAPPF